MDLRLSSLYGLSVLIDHDTPSILLQKRIIVDPAPKSKQNHLTATDLGWMRGVEMHLQE